jgi:diguanylate cyclase (GGDEF)-like protein
MAAMLGQTPEVLCALAPDELVAAMSAAVEVQPELVRDGRLLPTRENPLVCEEFEVTRPSRSVIRWVARWVPEPTPAQIIVATDITAQVDLTAAYQRLAMTDGLTGLANRRHAEQTMRRELSRAQRYGTKLCLALLDIDFFKRINDSQGHGVGDEVLMGIGRTITASIRESDFAARWGGEEFLLLMPNADLEGAVVCCERIRASVASSIHSAGQPVTVSIGISLYQSGEPVEAILARADQKLYEAKNTGRNRLAS